MSFILEWLPPAIRQEQWIPWALGAGVAVMAGVLWGHWRSRPTKVVFRTRMRPLLTDNEWDFFETLREAVPEWHVLAQVSMGALMEPDIDGGGAAYFAIRGRYAQKVVDFVVIDEGGAVVALIELDDQTHQPERDAERDAMTACAGYVTLRYESRSKPDARRLRADLQSA